MASRGRGLLSASLKVLSGGQPFGAGGQREPDNCPLKGILSLPHLSFLHQAPSSGYGGKEENKGERRRNEAGGVRCRTAPAGGGGRGHRSQRQGRVLLLPPPWHLGALISSQSHQLVSAPG